MKRLLLVIALALLLPGCAPRPTVVGTWSSMTSMPNGSRVTMQTSLRPNGTFTAQVSLQSIVYTGTYTVSDGILTETTTGYAVNGRTLTLPPALRAAQTERYAVQVSAQTLTLTPQNGGSPVVWQRVARP